MIGQPILIAKSMMAQTFLPKPSPTDPPNTVLSCAYTATGRPSMVPRPVTTPSPNGLSGLPGALTSWPISTKLPASRSSAIRWRGGV